MRAVRLEESGTLDSQVDLAKLPEILAEGSGVLWVDMLSKEENTRHVLGEIFRFHHLAIEDCTNGRVDTPKIDDYGDYLFIAAQSIGYGEIGELLKLTEVAIFLGKSYVVTVRSSAVAELDELYASACEYVNLMNRGADFLTHTILDSLVDLILPVVEAMDEHLDELEVKILDRPDKDLLPQVILLKRNTLRLRRAILPQRDMVNRLSRGEYPLIGREALIFYRDIYDHIVRVEEMLEGLRDLADGALNSYLSSVNNRMNEIMKALSVVTVVFLPLTLIASIYGTNLDFTPFGLPGLEGGFIWMLTAMLVLAVALVAHFRHRNWF